MTGRRFKGFHAIFFSSALFFVLAIGMPISLVLFYVLGADGEMINIFTAPYYRRVFIFTAQQAVLSTFFSILLGLPGAYLVGRCQFPGRRILKSLSTVPFVLPPILAVLGFVMFFGNAGVLNGIRRFFMGDDFYPWRILYSLPGIIMAHVFYNFTLTLRIVGDAWQNLPDLELRAASSLGAGRFQRFFTVDFPRLIPAIITAAIITFLYCFMSLAIVLVLGGGPELSTIEVVIFTLIKNQLDFSGGSSLALAESLLIFLLFIVYARVDSLLRSRTRDDAQNSMLRKSTELRGLRLLLAQCYLIPTLLFILGPLISIIVNGFLSRATRISGLKLDFIHWQRLFSSYAEGVPIRALVNSVLLASVVALFSTCIASALAWYAVKRVRWRKWIETAMVLPLGISSIILGLGWLLLLQRIPHNDFFRFITLGTAHSLMSIPFCFRIVYGRLKQISLRIPQAAHASGAGMLQTFIYVEMPMTRKALVTSMVFAFALSAGEFNATMILSPSNFTTLPLTIYRLIGAYNFSGACVMGTVLMLICGLAFFLLDQLSESQHVRY